MSAPRSFVTGWRVRLGYPLALACFYLARPTAGTLLIGALIALIGLTFRGLAAGYLRKGQGLATSGPYAHTRNPLYFGSVILAGGFAVAANSWIAAVLIAAYLLAFYPAVMRREENEMRLAYGIAFDDYARSVPLFFPSHRKRIPSAAPFSGAQYLRNREYQAAIGTAVALAILCARMWVRARWSV
jgi:steroid 5-alpha reductase family enzyme